MRAHRRTALARRQAAGVGLLGLRARGLRGRAPLLGCRVAGGGVRGRGGCGRCCWRGRCYWHRRCWRGHSRWYRWCRCWCRRCCLRRWCRCWRRQSCCRGRGGGCKDVGGGGGGGRGSARRPAPALLRLPALRGRAVHAAHERALHGRLVRASARGVCLGGRPRLLLGPCCLRHCCLRPCCLRPCCLISPPLLLLWLLQGLCCPCRPTTRLPASLVRRGRRAQHVQCACRHHAHAEVVDALRSSGAWLACGGP